MMSTDSSEAILSVLVENAPGVLVRAASLFSRRGYNIDSLTVSKTENPLFSRMTIVASGSGAILEQIHKQLEKLEDVVEVHRLCAQQVVLRELALVAIAAGDHQRSAVVAAVEIFRGRVIDVQPKRMTIEVTGDATKVDALIDLLRPYGILQVTRTGLTALNPQESSWELQLNRVV